MSSYPLTFGIFAWLAWPQNRDTLNFFKHYSLFVDWETVWSWSTYENIWKMSEYWSFRAIQTTGYFWQRKYVTSRSWQHVNFLAQTGLQTVKGVQSRSFHLRPYIVIKFSWWATASFLVAVRQPKCAVLNLFFLNFSYFR